MVDVREDEREGLEEDVQDTKEDRGECTEEGYHGFEDEKLEGAFAGADDGVSDGAVEFLNWCLIAWVASGLAEGDSTLTEQDWVVGFRDKEVEGDDCEGGPNH